MDFTSLHSHSTFSFLDGYAMPEAHCARVAELGMSALALTEHGNVSSAVALEKAAAKHGIKPVFGIEAYCGAAGQKMKHHLGILAMDQGGYANLMRLVTQSWDDYYYLPTLHGSVLARYQEGLAVLSGCTGSKLACDLTGGKGVPDHAPDLAAASATAARFRDLLGDRYCLEVQAFPELAKTRAVNPAYERIGRELGIPLIATCDVHYPYPDDSGLQEILHSVRGQGGESSGFEYSIPLSYPESDLALWERLKETGLSRRAASEAIENTAILAERCSVTLPKAEPLRYPASEEDWLPWDEVAW